MTLYRPHRGSLADAMAEVVEIADIAALRAHVNAGLKKWNMEIGEGDLRLEPYGYDKRIDWNTYIVTMKNTRQNYPKGVWYFGEDMGPDYFGAIGFTNGPL